jgi:GT2 family glycosyltransferase
VERDAVGSISLKTLAIIVNYKVAALALKAVESVLASDSDGMVQVAVVDNSEDEDEAERLRQGLPSSVSLLVNSRNIGFGRACNLAFERFHAEQVLLLNPDARLLPNCLLRLQQTLSDFSGVAAVSPQMFWDDALHFFLPRSIPPALFSCQDLLGPFGPDAAINRLVSAAWRYSCIRVWRSRGPVRVSNLSGGHVLLDRQAVIRAGGLFDPRFFLYFEDTDLFIRLRRSGHRLLVDPRARAVHYVDQCGREDRDRKQRLMAESRRELLDKYPSGLGRWTGRLTGRLAGAPVAEKNPPGPPDFTAPFVLDVPVPLRKEWLFEVSPHPTFIPSAGRFGNGATMVFPQEQWAMLAPGRYFGRLGRPAALGGVSCCVTWRIDGNGRSQWKATPLS